MKELDKSKVYNLNDLNQDELLDVLTWLQKNDTPDWEHIEIDSFKIYVYNHVLYWSLLDKEWLFSSHKNSTANAKELFYTLENIQVDCRELTEEQVKEMADVFEKNGFIIGNLAIFGKYYFLSHLRYRCCTTNIHDENKTTITYEKFMELFAPKYEVTMIAEKPKEFQNLVESLNEELTEEAYKETKPQHYSKGIDTFNPQPHYNNENGSLYKIANDLNLNHWEFDIFKRLVRCRKKKQFKEDLQKIKDTIDIYLSEYSE